MSRDHMDEDSSWRAQASQLVTAWSNWGVSDSAICEINRPGAYAVSSFPVLSLLPDLCRVRNLLPPHSMCYGPTHSLTSLSCHVLSLCTVDSCLFHGQLAWWVFWAIWPSYLLPLFGHLFYSFLIFVLDSFTIEIIGHFFPFTFFSR